MAYIPSEIDEKVVSELNSETADLSGKKLEEVLTDLAREMLVSSQIYKQPRMNMIAVYERLYNNDVLPKLRQLFNAVLPVFSGLIDELLAMYNDEIKLKFEPTNPSKYLITPKIQAHWEKEAQGLKPNQMWNYKNRVGRFNSLLSGRIIGRSYAYNDPVYTNVYDNINYSDFHCQPMGGGILENHTFCGTESNYQTMYDIASNPKYDRDQVAKLKVLSSANRLDTALETTYGTKFSRWKALGLDIETNNFTGELTYNLCDFIITYNGVRYNIVFEPYSGIWLYVKRWTEIMPSGEYCYKSGATHEDDKNFWSKSYADDFYTIADAILILFNQELTNREKKNYNARAFDPDMFTDVAKLDAAQNRPDALVPVKTLGGTKKIADGIYAFDTPQLQGTINLIDWMSQYTGNKTGADELPQGSEKNKASVVMALQQKQSKRIGLHSDSFNEYYRQIGRGFLEGMSEYMPPKLSIEMIGEGGFIEKSELKRIDVKNIDDIKISVVSSSEQESADSLKKQGQVQAITMVTETPNLTRYEKETIYRNIGQFDESEIMFLLDTQGALSKKQYAHASEAIQQILLGIKPEIYYGADGAYLKYIDMYLVDNKNKIKGKEKNFMQFLATMAPIVQANVKKQAQAQPQPAPAAGGGQAAPQKAQPAPAQKPSISMPQKNNPVPQQ